jgi:hypothetical protein
MQWRVILMADGKSAVRHVKANSAALARWTAISDYKLETGLDATVGHVLRIRR